MIRLGSEEEASSLFKAASACNKSSLEKPALRAYRTNTGVEMSSIAASDFPD